MRSDMAKVIVERPRVGGQGARKGRSPRDLDHLPKRQGLRRAARQSGDWKTLNEHLNPLRRYLHGQVGRPWNSVWSDICANLRPTSAVQQHVRDHIFDFVAKDVIARDSEVYVNRRYFGGPIPLRDSGFELWIDPGTGILRENRHRITDRQRRRARRRHEEQALRQRVVTVSDQQQYHLLADGGWWEVTLALVPTHEEPRKYRGQTVGIEQVESPVYDAVLGPKLSELPRHVLYDRCGVYATAKRKLSKKEIKRLRLRSPVHRSA